MLTLIRAGRSGVRILPENGETHHGMSLVTRSQERVVLMREAVLRSTLGSGTMTMLHPVPMLRCQVRKRARCDRVVSSVGW
jgi:hypothetical protein